MAPPRVFCHRFRLILGQLADEAFELSKLAMEILRFGCYFLTNNIVKEILVDAGLIVEAGFGCVCGVFKVSGVMELF